MRTPAAGYRLAIAIRYWHSARIVISNQVRPVEYMEPVGYLLAMATELALKALLVDSGVTDRELASKQLGHDLGACLRRAVQNGLEVSEAEARTILNMREGHLSHFNRYGPKADNGNLQLGAFFLTDETAGMHRVAALIDRVSGDPSKLRRQWQHPSDLEWPVTLPLLSFVDLNRLKELEAENRAEVDRVAKLNSGFREQGILPP
ncbi:hypothetical protein EFR00_30445 [Rhizobium sophoriradicis]|uniref:hypothetical protein n=1 Tax=Rhizobium sophoriradicis TaxID=1535245 RepID=UPI00098F7FCD|nr:hypothetical protein [Rhizobium sophoriradicis]RSB82468.1 hypothetical protein EFR00_30445 [Rhizobium sophoriradicis]